MFNQQLHSKHKIKEEGEEGRKEEVFYLPTHSTHFIYGYLASDIW